MIREGCEGACVAKKKSGPWPAQAVPSLRSLASKLAGIASRRFALLDFARSISCGAVSLSAAITGAIKQSKSSARFLMAQILYRAGRIAGVGRSSHLQAPK